MILITLYWLIFCEIASLKFGTTQFQFLFRLIKFPASSLVKGLTDFQRKKQDAMRIWFRNLNKFQNKIKTGRYR